MCMKDFQSLKLLCSNGAWTQLIEQCYTVNITNNKAYLIVSEEQIAHWSQLF